MVVSDSCAVFEYDRTRSILVCVSHNSPRVNFQYVLSEYTEMCIHPGESMIVSIDAVDYRVTRELTLYLRSVLLGDVWSFRSAQGVEVFSLKGDYVPGVYLCVGGRPRRVVPNVGAFSNEIIQAEKNAPCMLEFPVKADGGKWDTLFCESVSPKIILVFLFMAFLILVLSS